MSIKVTNISGLRIGVPSPINDILEIGEEKTYDHVEWDEAVNDERIAEMIQKNQLVVEKAGVEEEVPLATTAPMEIWVDTTGSDSGGDGTEANPYATLAHAIAQVPFRINDVVHIRIGAGTFVENSLDNLTFSYGINGHLCIEGVGTPTVSSGPFAISSFASNPNSAYTIITATGTPWVADALFGKWVRVTAGTGVGHIWPVYSNSTSTIAIPYVNTAGVGTVTEVEILDGPATTIEVPTGLVFGGAELNLVNYSGGSSRLSIGGVRFKTDALGQYPFGFSSLNAWLSFVEFETPSPTVQAWIYSLFVENSWINAFLPLTDNIFDNVLFNSVDMSQFATKRGSTAWAGGWASGTILIDGHVFGLCDRLLVTCFVYSDMYESAAGYVNVSGLSFGYFSNVLLDPASMTYGVAPLHGGNTTYSAYALHVERSPADAIALYPITNASLGNTTSTPANVVGHGINVFAGCKVARSSTATTISGTAGDTVFNQTSATNAWPAAGTAVTDSQGAYVISEP